jgi:aminopeptidase N
MLRNSLVLACILLLIFTFFPFTPLFAEEVWKDRAPFLIHQLEVHLNPKDHTLQARDTLQVRINPDLIGSDPQTFSFFLNKELKVLEIYQEEPRGILTWESLPRDDRSQEIRLQIPAGARETFSFTLRYEGIVYDPVQKSQDLSFITGDMTTGLIGEEGVYLSEATYWYPEIPKSLSIFNLVVTIPEPFVVVTQGELLSRETREGLSKSQWRSEIPAEAPTLVAGKYQVRTRDWNGVAISAYFSLENMPLADKFIQAAGEYIQLYSQILGPYPYKKFDIVENFFSSGYGFPSFTLLGKEVIRLGERALQPGYLDHEIVHSWLGNYVFYDPDKGNWVEALTTYCTNYYYKELKQGEEAAFKYRKRASQQYSIRVTPDKEYPVRAFRGKTEDYENDIGYTKGAMIFHQLRRWIGEGPFFLGLKEIVRRYGGHRANWEDLQTVFEEVSHQPLDWFFRQWLDLKGGPELKLENVKLEALPKGYRVTGQVIQRGDVYRLQLPIQLRFKEERKTFHLDLTERENPFIYTVDRAPLSLVLDSEYHVFRKIAPEALNPCLNALLEDKDKLLIYPTEGTAEEIAIYRGLAEMAVIRKGGKVLPDTVLTGDLFTQNSLLILGNARKSALVREWLTLLPEGFELTEDGFRLGDKNYTGEETALLVTWRNPKNPMKYLTLYFGLAPGALSRARYLFYYGWDSYVIFDKGYPIQQGDWPEGPSDTVYYFQ